MLPFENKRKKQFKQMKEAMEDQDEIGGDLNEMSEKQIAIDFEDMRRIKSGQYTNVPDDIWQVRYMETVPHTESRFDQEVTKDNVLANVTGMLPTIDEVRFNTQTINLIKNIFVIDKEFPVVNEDGEIARDANGNFMLRTLPVFDIEFKALTEALEIDLKAALATSRGKGADREAILMRTANLIKKVGKQKEQQSMGLLGTGAR